MNNVACPWCDTQLAVDMDDDRIRCESCSVVTEFAAEPLPELAQAA